MNRRDFITFAAQMGVLVSLPHELAVGQLPHLAETSPLECFSPELSFNPEHEYGLAIRFSGRDISREFKIVMRQMLVDDASVRLPAGTPFQIREKIKELGGCRDGGMAWYYNKFIDRSEERIDRPTYNALGSYIYWGRYLAKA